jgi:hypothetical protein
MKDVCQPFAASGARETGVADRISNPLATSVIVNPSQKDRLHRLLTHLAPGSIGEAGAGQPFAGTVLSFQKRALTRLF